MPPSDDEELRTLQHKAYGRDGGLTDAEAARLRELEDARSARAEADGAPAVAHVREENPAGEGEDPPAPPAELHVVAPASGDPVAASRSDGVRQMLRRYWKVVAAASAALVIIGLAAGWALFGRGIAPAIVPSGQQEALAMIQEGTYDPGSIRFTGEKHGVAIWRATRDGGTRDCIVVTREDQLSSECREIGADADENASIGVSTGLDFVEDGQNVMVWASFLPDISGEEVTIVQRSIVDHSGWEMQYTDAERADVERLEQEGFDPDALQVIGYDDDLPVWQGWRDEETCLAAVVDDDAHVSCRAISADGDTVRLRVGTTEYELRETANRGQLFSIIRHAAPSDGSADPLELGGEHGDPIEVTPETPEP